jgi:hypothetical protein
MGAPKQVPIPKSDTLVFDRSTFMQWLISLETENDPIPACRLMNIFRRKGVKIRTFHLTAGPAGYSLMAVVETAEAEVEHLFHYLRRTEGIRNVSYYRHQPTEDATFVLIEAGADTSSLARFAQAFPESKMIFASQGQYLFQVMAKKGTRPLAAGLEDVRFLPFAQVKVTAPAERGTWPVAVAS